MWLKNLEIVTTGGVNKSRWKKKLEGYIAICKETTNSLLAHGHLHQTNCKLGFEHWFERTASVMQIVAFFIKLIVWHPATSFFQFSYLFIFFYKIPSWLHDQIITFSKRLGLMLVFGHNCTAYIDVRLKLSSTILCSLGIRLFW